MGSQRKPYSPELGPQDNIFLEQKLIDDLLKVPFPGSQNRFSVPTPPSSDKYYFNLTLQHLTISKT